ncbi:MAG: YtxH domain-containing protein [Patescibacteria group bacterium]
MSDNEEKKEKSSTVDRLVMGVIIGGAIGSVVGMAFAPLKGKDTRKIIHEKGKEYIDKGREVSSKIREQLAAPEGKGKVEIKPQNASFWRWLLFGRKKGGKKN